MVDSSTVVAADGEQKGQEEIISEKNNNNKYYPSSDFETTDHTYNEENDMKTLSNFILERRKSSSSNSSNNAILHHKKFRMIALDLDGTLLNLNHVISNKSVEYLRHLHVNCGVKVILASGRAPQTMYEHVIKLNLPYGEDGMPIICYNGAVGLYVKPKKQRNDDNGDDADSTKAPINDMATSTFKSSYSNAVDVKEIFSTSIPKDVTKQCIDLAKKLNHVVQYYHNEIVYANPTQNHHYELCNTYMNLTGCKTVFVTNNDNDNNDNNNNNDNNKNNNEDFENLLCKNHLPSKILVMCDKSDQDEMMNEFTKHLGNKATIIRGSYGWFLEVLHKDVCKGHGLKELCNHLDDNIELDEIITFGDGDNDYEFIKYSGLGIAMCNGRNCIKNVSDIITELDHDNDGVVYELRKMMDDGKNKDLFF